MKIYKIQDGGQPPYLNRFLALTQLAADRPISVKFCVGNQNSMAMEVM